MNEVVSDQVRSMPGPAALPRANGELVFDAPWEGRILGAAIGVVEHLGIDWDEFRQRLIAAIAADPDHPYYESWTAALESLVTDYELGSRDDLARRADRAVRR
jgi:hypothetical protein